MRIPDSQLEEWWRLVAQEPVPAVDPMEAKLALARFIVRRSHGGEAARRAEQHFTRVVRQGDAPEEVPEVAVAAETVHLPQLLAEQFGETTSHWRRVVDQGGVSVDGRKIDAYDVPVEELEGAVLQAGKRRFLRIRRGA
jgi:tyrosyl-tRNA synthetase